jgi:hypothetical protein
MTDWRADFEVSLAAFCNEHDLARSLFRTKYLPAPHQPTPLPAGKMGVYGFWLEDWGWLKIGKVGPNSDPRWSYQHYHFGSAPSTLAESMRQDPEMKVSNLDKYELATRIKQTTCRANILMSSQVGGSLLSELESFLLKRLKPRYEGRKDGGFIFRSFDGVMIRVSRDGCSPVSPA